MEKYILGGIAIIIILDPSIAWRVYKIHQRSRSINEVVSKPFVCPNCGHRFYTKQKIIHPITENKVFLKCPSCGKRDICGRPYDFNEK